MFPPKLVGKRDDGVHRRFGFIAQWHSCLLWCPGTLWW